MEAFSARAQELLNLATSYGVWWLVFCYVFLYLSAIVESLFPPYPGDVVTFAGGYLASLGKLNFPLVFLATSLGSLSGLLLLYAIGQRHGRRLFQKEQSHWRTPAHLAKVERWFVRYGAKILIASRFLSGIRSGIALAAGIGNIGWRRMVLYGTVSILLWNGLILFVSSFVEQNWQRLYGLLLLYNKVLFGGLLLTAIGFGIWWWRKRQVPKGAA